MFVKDVDAINRCFWEVTSPHKQRVTAESRVVVTANTDLEHGANSATPRPEMAPVESRIPMVSGSLVCAPERCQCIEVRGDHAAEASLGGVYDASRQPISERLEGTCH